MPLDLFLTFLGACVLLFIKPGPAMSVIVANSVEYRTSGGLITVAGNILGCTILIGTVAFGLAWIAEAMRQWFDWIRLVGALYLIWLGVWNRNERARAFYLKYFLKRRFFLKHWAKKNPIMPEQAYDEYMMVAKVIDKTYGNGFGYGFETDRGRVFMKYGRPDDIVTVENEMNAPPYEVWIYYKMEKTQQSNVKFLFYNPNLIANGHRLLHTTCRGEIQNPRWKHELYKSAPGELIGNSVDGRDVKDNFNRRADQIFNDN